MPSFEVLEKVIWWLSITGHAVLYLRLVTTGLRRTYKFFSIYVLFRLLRSLLLEAVPNLQGSGAHQFDSTVYAQIWLLTEPVLWVLYVLVVLELYGLIFQKYKGIASLGRWVVLGGLAAALVLSSLSLAADLSNPTEQFPILRYFLAIGRGVLSSLLLCLLCITAFLTWCPVPLNRNIVVHSILYAVYFLSMAVVVLLRNLTGSEATLYVNVVMSSITLLCLAVWIAALNRQGEIRSVRLRSHWREGQDQLVINQLATINNTLMRAARK